MKPLKRIIAAWLTVMCLLAGLGVQAAGTVREISQTTAENVKWNGKIYMYAITKEYEASNPEEKISFEDMDGMKLDQIDYQTIDTIYPTKTQVLKEKKEYKELFQKDESGIDKTLTVNGNTYSLDHVEWSEEPNVEHVSYTQDYGYATSEPKAAATYEYTYTSPVTKKKNTVILPLLRLDQGEYRWVDGFSATVTFKNLDGVYFKLGSHEFAYNPDKLALTDVDYKELVKLLGYDTGKYRLNSGRWLGKAYEKKGIKYRKATVTGQQYAAPYQAVYEDDIQNGSIYTANAIYTYSQEVTDETAEPTYVVKATAYYEKATPSVLLTIGIVIVVLLVIAVLYVFSRKKKNVSSSREKENLYRL